MYECQSNRGARSHTVYVGVGVCLNVGGHVSVGFHVRVEDRVEVVGVHVSFEICLEILSSRRG